MCSPEFKSFQLQTEVKKHKNRPEKFFNISSDQLFDAFNCLRDFIFLFLRNLPDSVFLQRQNEFTL